ncbi:MAG: DUF3291 domain-containing protein [Flavobacteriales bacterium]|nr:DUF3291 domain-containing protein [Flavobacteriales bacterium]
MTVSITSITSRSPLKFLALASHAKHVVKQFEASACVNYKIKGVWAKHYTMTLWNNVDDINSFYRNNAHKKAMQATSK